MAKKTKAADLSIEEKLEQALIVPGYEPYTIPDNWCWLKLLASFDNCTDSKKKVKQKQYLESGTWAIIDQGKQKIGGYTNDEALLYTGNLPVIIFGDHTRCIKYIDFPFAQGADGVKVLSPKSFYLPKLFYYALQSVEIPNLGYRRHFPIFDRFAIPLPPLPEQHRIVERIESLFSKLDEAKEKAQEVIDSFETRKAAILHKAFSGELTAKWREENGVGIESWERKTLGEVCNSIFDGDHMPPPKSETGIPFLVISNVNDGYLSFENTRFVPQEYYDAITDTRKPEKGDVLYTLVGSFGIPVVVDTNAPFCFQRHMALLKPKSINTYFLWYLLQSQEMYQKASSIAKGVAQLTVPIKGLRLMDFNCPSEEEQIEIVRVLESMLEKEGTSKDNAESVIDQIDTMKKAILARAFRGELGTNDPEEESAVELLKEILSGNNNEEEPQKPKRTRIVIPKEIDHLLKTELERKIVRLFLKSETGEVTAEEIMGVSSKKVDLLDSVASLKEKKLIKQLNNELFILLR